MGYAWQIIGLIYLIGMDKPVEGLIMLLGGTILNAIDTAVARIKVK